MPSLPLESNRNLLLAQRLYAYGAALNHDLAKTRVLYTNYATEYYCCRETIAIIAEFSVTLALGLVEIIRINCLKRVVRCALVHKSAQLSLDGINST